MSHGINVKYPGNFYVKKEKTGEKNVCPSNATSMTPSHPVISFSCSEESGISVVQRAESFLSTEPQDPMGGRRALLPTLLQG